MLPEIETPPMVVGDARSATVQLSSTLADGAILLRTDNRLDRGGYLGRVGDGAASCHPGGPFGQRS